MQASIDARDWESATRHCARAMALPDEVITGAFAESAVVCIPITTQCPLRLKWALYQPTPESHLPPVQTLQNAREHLLSIFRASFSEATKARDAAATTRFFKLFPAIGWEAEGLEAYASFVVDLVKVRPPASAKSENNSPNVTGFRSDIYSFKSSILHHGSHCTI